MASSEQPSFDVKFLMMLRNFFLEIVSDGNPVNQRKSFELATELPEYRALGENFFFDHVLGATGHPSFRTLLQRFHPTSSSKELQNMIRLAFPKPGRTTRAVSIDERAELTQLFHMFDTDKSNSLSLQEFITATRAMKMLTSDQVFWMYAADTNGDGELSLQEFISGMHNCHF